MISGRNTEAVGRFMDSGDWQSAIDDLLNAGFDRAELSLLAGEEAVRKKLGHAYRSVTELEDDLAVPTTAYFDPESRHTGEAALAGGLFYVGAVTSAGAVVASGGTLAAALVSAALIGGAGSAVGSLLAYLIEDHHTEHIEEQLSKGGLLLWVRTRDAAHEKRAIEILRKNGGMDVHLHQIAYAPTLKTSTA